MEFFRSVKGSVSIFLCLLLLPMITYSTMIVDATRLQTARSSIATAGDLAMNAAMSEYEQTLEDMYGLFAVSKSPEELKDHLYTYFTETLEGKIYNGKQEDFDTEGLAQVIVNAIFSDTPEDDLSDLINLKSDYDSFDYYTVPGSTLANQAIMKKQIIEYMKYKGPVSLVSTIFSKINFLSNSSEQTKVVEKKIEYTETLGELQKVCEEAWKAYEGTSDSDPGYNGTAKSFNDSYGSPNVVNDLVTYAQDMFKLASRCYIMNKNTHVKPDSKLSSWSSWDYASKSGSFNMDNFYNDVYVDDSDVRDDNIDYLITDLRSAMDRAKSSYNCFINLSSPGNGDFASGHLDVSFTSLSYLQSNESASISVSVSPKSGSTIDKVNNYYSALAGIDISRVNFSAPEEDAFVSKLEEYYKKQNEAYDFAKDDSIQQDFIYIKAAYEYSKAISDKCDNLFSRYKSLFEKKIRDDCKASNPDMADDELNTLINTEIHDRESNRTSDFYRYEYYNKLMKELTNSFRSYSYESNINNFVSKVNYTDKYLDRAKVYLNAGSGGISIYYNSLLDVVSKCNTVIEKLEAIETKISDSETKKNNWQSSINDVADGSTKSTMQSDLDTTTDGLKKSDVTALKNVMTGIKSDFEGRKSQIDSMTFLSQIVRTISSDSIKDNSVFDGKDDDIKNNGNKIVDENFDRGSFTEDVAKTEFKAEIIDGNPSGTDEDPKEKFYLTLKSICEPLKTEKTEEQQNVVNNINNVIDVDEDGKPKGEDNIPDAEEGSGGETSGTTDKANGKTIGEIYDEIAAEAKVAKVQEKNDDKVGNSNKFDSGKSDYSDDSGKAKDSLKKAQNILEGFKTLANDAMSCAYLEEYFTEIFTCRTDPVLAKKGNTITYLNGYSIGDGSRTVNQDTEWYGKEVEYILWGNEDLGKNYTYTDSWIYVVRFALNAIYAFTAADIQSFALELATAIAGWTVIGVPIVQACITIAIALAESAYDMKLLHDGKDVAIYKNSSNFVCSPTGLAKAVVTEVAQTAIEKATEKAKEAINNKIDELQKKAYTKIDDAMGDVEEILNNYVTQESQTIKSAITDQFVTPIVNSVSAVFTNVDKASADAKSILDKNIEESINNAWSKIGTNINNSMKDGIVKDLTKKIYDTKGEDGKNALIEKVKSCYHDFIDDITPENPATKIREALVSEEIVGGVPKGLIPQWINPVEQEIKNYITTETNDIKEEVHNLGDEGVKNIKDTLNRRIDSFSSSISGTVTEGIEGMKPSTSGINLSKEPKDKSSSGGFTLNYKEYCKIMVLIKLIAGQEGVMLNRAATLMQANVATAKENSNKNFEIKKAYTLIGVSSNVEMGTLFPWAVEVTDTSEVDGGLNASFDSSLIGKYTVKIKYNAVNGY